MTLMALNSETFEPSEWYERNTHRGSWYGYTEDFHKYMNIHFYFNLKNLIIRIITKILLIPFIYMIKYL